MAAEDISRDDTANQKRGVCVAVMEGITEAQILSDGAIPFVLPDNVLITSAAVNITTVSSTGSATVDILVGATVIANEVAVTAAGFVEGIDSTTRKYSTGGNVTIKSGGTAPAAGELVTDLIVTYIELDKHTGEYTEFYSA